MKLNYSKRRDRALTLVEVLVVMAVVTMLAVLFWPAAMALSNSNKISSRLSCNNNLKQVGLAFAVWAGDHNGKYPMDISETNGGAKELVAAGNVMGIFRVVSNELSTPVVLYCPADLRRSAAAVFGPGFTESNISYFIGADANHTNYQTVLTGDDHMQVGNIPAKPGLIALATNVDVAWTAARHEWEKEHFWMQDPHRNVGNIGLADGSAIEVDSIGLRESFQSGGMATNRLVMP